VKCYTGVFQSRVHFLSTPSFPENIIGYTARLGRLHRCRYQGVYEILAVDAPVIGLSDLPQVACLQSLRGKQPCTIILAGRQCSHAGHQGRGTNTCTVSKGLTSGHGRYWVEGVVGPLQRATNEYLGSLFIADRGIKRHQSEYTAL